MENNYLFLYSLLLGICLDFVYEAVNFVRKIVSKKKFTLVTDVLTVLLFGIATFFFFCAYTNGRIRLIFLISEACGFLALHFTFGAVCNVFYRICIAELLRKFEKILKKFKKLKITAKNLLKNINKMLYNIFKKENKEVVENARGKKRKKGKKAKLQKSA